MSEKVLGFVPSKEVQAVTANNEKVWAVYEKDLVSVRLASESVDLKRLKARLNTLAFDAGTKELHQDYLVALQNIEDWAEKEAKN